ncbi:helix-turn-helix domain-containing protein [Chloroflexota bacterium]
MVKKVKLVRIAQGYPSYKFTALVGVHPNWWREIEMGTREPSNSVMLRASEILNRSADELFADADVALIPSQS